jgi:hypothetical protein
MPALKMPAIAAEADQAPLITKANGMAVRMRERTNPVRYDLRLPLLAPVLSISA